MADTDLQDDLPELEGVAMEPAAEPSALAALEPVAAAAPSTFSAKDLTDDILGGVDFDLPAPPPSAAQPKPAPAAKAPVTGGFKPPAALFGQSGGFGASGLKPAAPALAKAPVPQPAAPQPVAIAPAPIAAPPVAAHAPAFEPIFDTRDLAPPTPDAKEALRAALTATEPPDTLPPDTARAVFQLARVLVAKGIVTVDELLA